MNKIRIATVWLDGCSGCHMSFLDMDERLLAIADQIDLVYSPLVDAKVFPENVDLTFVEGAVSNDDDLHKLKIVRSRTRLLAALGDCAVTSNVPGMRNYFSRDEILRRAYLENASFNQSIPSEVIPRLLPKSKPIHEIVKVDLFVPGCPPHAESIFTALAALLEGRLPDPGSTLRFG
ncbi:MAG: ubiquinone oxidoreductase, 20 kDa subunit [Proteobacteria bacterium]|nr:ubiquinone oxidoreductase, 20 kDa subunit [Pseudomonadota bacterium]